MKYHIFIFTFIFFLSTQFSIAIAPTPKQATPSSVASSSADDLIDSTSDLGNDIQKIRDVVKLKVQEKLKDISSDTNNQPQKKSIIGTIIQIDNLKLTIDYQNNTRSINIDPEVSIIDLKRNKAKIENLKVGQEVMVMGYQEDNVFTAKRIVLTDIKASILKDQIVIGNVVDISQTSSIIVIIPTRDKNTQYQIKTDSKTIIVDRNNNKIDSKKVLKGQKIITIIKPENEKSKTYIASKIIILDNLSSSASKKE